MKRNRDCSLALLSIKLEIVARWMSDSVLSESASVARLVLRLAQGRKPSRFSAGSPPLHELVRKGRYVTISGEEQGTAKIVSLEIILPNFLT
jgi:hypothetical protein